MKIVFFNYKAVEEKAVNSWKENNKDIELVITEKELSEDTMDMLKDCDAVCISQIKPISEQVYDFAKENGVKVFSTRSAGIDMYDTKKLNSLGIKLTNVPSYSPNAIAEHAVTAALIISRKIAKIEKNVKEHNFSWEKRLLSREMRTMTVGILGTGRIGTAAAKLFKGLGANVIGYDLYPNDNAKEYLTYVDSVETLAKQSDIISLHMPATEENYHMVNDKFFELMPENSIIINSGRGSLIDTKALFRALDSKKLLGAGLDVYEFESPYVPKDMRDKEIEDADFLQLIEREDILYTPHTAYFTETAVENLVQGALNSSKNFIENGNDDFVVKF